MNECLGTMQAEMADTRKEIAVPQMDVRKDLTQFHRGMERLERSLEQWCQEMRQEMQQWRLSTTCQLWAMVGITGGAFTVILAAVIKLAFFP